MKVFLDTGVFIAIFIDKDINHEQVTKSYRDLKRERVRFYTSNFVLSELYTRLMYDFGERVTYKAIEVITGDIVKGNVWLVEVEGTIFKKAVEIFLRYAEHKVSFTDATSYVIYKDLQLDEVFAVDSDFRKMRARVRGV
jgi:uncharacterized protein